MSARDRALRYAAGVAAVVVFGGVPAFAQETPPPPAAPQAAAPQDTVEEIVITTQKRAQNLQDVPISVTAITGQEISDLGISKSVDIAAQTPGLKIGFPAGETNNPAIFLRGVGLNDYNANSNGSVGWYMDDIYISQVTAQTFQLYDLERVEIARGPQGTLYGRNTTGGLVNFISKKPSHDEREGYVMGSVGKWNTYKLEGAYGAPITDTLAGRLSFSYNKADGYISNGFPGGDLQNDTDNWAGRLGLSWQPNDGLDVAFNLHGAQNRSLAAQYEHQGTNDPVTGAPCTRSQIRSDICVDALGYRDGEGHERGEYNKEGDLDVDSWGTYLRTAVDVGEMTLTSITAYEWIYKTFEEDSDASPNRLLEIDYLNDAWEFTQELRLAGEADRLHWQTGLYYLNERIRADNFLDLFGELRPVVEAIDPIAYPGGFDPGGAAIGAPIFFSKTSYTQKDESFAIFGQVEYALTEQLRATLGARYTWEWRDFAENVQFQEPTFTVPVFALTDHVKFGEWSGKFGLDYKPVEDLLLYVSASRGFKSGGFSGAFAFDPAELPSFDPEILWAYEAGAKWDLFDKRLRVNASGFYYDYKDLQVFTVVAVGPNVAVTVLDNAGQATLYGGEIELEARPTEGLSVALGLELLHSELTEYSSDAGVDYSGNKLVFAPDVSFNGRVRYDLPLGPGKLGLQTDWNYQAKVFFDSPKSERLRLFLSQILAH